MKAEDKTFIIDKARKIIGSIEIVFKNEMEHMRLIGHRIPEKAEMNYLDALDHAFGRIENTIANIENKGISSGKHQYYLAEGLCRKELKILAPIYVTLLMDHAGFEPKKDRKTPARNSAKVMESAINCNIEILCSYIILLKVKNRL